MAFQYLTNVPLEQAREEYLALLEEHGMAPRAETIPVEKALGRITAKPVYAHICAPHYHACAMDGIAVEARRTFGASETTPVFLPESELVRVDTGDPLPQGCDCVVMIEDVMEEEGGVRLYKAAAPWQHIRQIGEDVCAQEMLLTSHALITPAAMGAMLAAGILEVDVFRRPVIGIIPTGDEIVPPRADPGEGDIIEFNSTIFSAMLRQWGAHPVTFPIVKDKLELIVAALEQALEQCDAVILNAGSSAGREDFSTQAISQVGQVLYHGVAIKPGKPAILGCRGPKPILGVPGYPVSGIIVLDALFRPLVDRLSGRAPKQPVYTTATLTRAIVSTLKYREFVRVRLGFVGGKLVATHLNRGAGVVSSFLKADGILEVPQESEGYEAGSQVKVRLLRPLSELHNTLVITGSHDPLIDELHELMRQKWPEAAVGSSHVGSMGGIMAVRRGEAHAAGVHLLDEKTGEYNTAFIKKYFPKGGVYLVECVYRSQGLMVRKGNPKGIRSLADLTGEGMRFVNRQKGSGTRILCDYVCKRDGIDPGAIYGYDREEFTHTAVAALVATDSADAGMGIYSAAQLYGLDFLPVCEEQYDLLIPASAWENPAVQRLLEILKSPEFAARMQQLGGYRLERPGEVRQKF